MPGRSSRTRARRAALIGGGLALALGLAAIVGAPSVPATCSRILELAEGAGESVGPSERELCEQHYTRVRASRGVLGWTWTSWCTRLAHSIPEAGEC